MEEHTLGSYSNITVRVTYKALHLGEHDYEVTVENENDANNTERIKVRRFFNFFVKLIFTGPCTRIY